MLFDIKKGKLAHCWSALLLCWHKTRRVEYLNNMNGKVACECYIKLYFYIETTSSPCRCVLRLLWEISGCLCCCLRHLCLTVLWTSTSADIWEPASTSKKPCEQNRFHFWQMIKTHEQSKQCLPEPVHCGYGDDHGRIYLLVSRASCCVSCRAVQEGWSTCSGGVC